MEYMVIGHHACMMFGDKEIAVRIRSNSHYRIFIDTKNEQVGMLVGL